MFKQILLIFILVIIFYFIIKEIFISTHKLYISEDTVKYTMSNSDYTFLKKYSVNSSLSDITQGSIFYTTKQWSTKNNCYLKFKDKYYIIEPGYYYYNSDVTLFQENPFKSEKKKIASYLTPPCRFFSSMKSLSNYR